MKSNKFSSYLFLIFALGVLLLSCKSKTLPSEQKTETFRTITEVKRDTAFQIEKDSSYYTAYIDCVNGKPVLKEPNIKGKEPSSKAGKYLEKPKVSIDNNLLTIKCEQQARQLFISWRERYEKERIENTKTIPQYIPYPLTNWQKIQLYTGKITLGLLGLTILAYFIRFLITKKIF